MKPARISKLGKYQILGELGGGQMGTVYKGFDPGIERAVAIKTVRRGLAHDVDDESATQVERFKREAKAAGRLNHPNVVSIYEYGEDGETPFIVMEYIEGRSLKDFFEAQERFDLAGVVRIVSEILAGLEYSHKNGIVHRDIKPANVMIGSAGEVKITDFGIARIESSSLTQVGTVLGTPSYMSPEQFMGLPADARSDLFSAGAVLYQLLTNDKPFAGSLTAIMHKVLHTHPEPPSRLNVQVPAVFDGIVSKAMAKAPAERFQSALEFATALRAAAAGQAVPAPAPTPVRGNDDETMIVARRRPTGEPTPAEPARPAHGSAVPVAVPVAVALSGAGDPAPEAVPIPVAQGPAGPAAIGPGDGRRGREWFKLLGAALVGIVVGGGVTWGLRPALHGVGAVAVVPVLPDSPPEPALDPVRLGAELTRVVDGLPCTVLKSEVATDGFVRISGLAGAGMVSGLLDAAVDRLLPGAGRVFDVEDFDRKLCEPLTTALSLRPAVAGQAPVLRTIPAGAVFRNGQDLMLEIEGPDFASFLQVDYFTLEGQVIHLFPNPLERDDRLAARAVRRLGARTAGGRFWIIGPPFGRELLVAVTGPIPLFDSRRPEVETIADYLPALRRALSASAERRAIPTATAVFIRTTGDQAPDPGH